MKTRLIGMRTLKTAISLSLCLLVYIIFRVLDEEVFHLYNKTRGFRFSDWYNPFFAGIATAYSLYPSKKQSIAQAKNRIVSSLLGGIIGMILTIGYGLIGYISGNDNIIWPHLGKGFRYYQYIIPYTLVGIFSILVVVVGNKLNKKNAIFVGILTFISVTVNPMGMIVDRYNQSAEFLGETVFGLNRIISTVVGVSIALLVNIIRLPHKNKNKDMLFVIGIEGLLKEEHDTIKGFFNYKMNKVCDDGINTTIFTTRVPSTFMYLVETTQINNPVVCMSGAALFDTKTLTYLDTECIPYNDTIKIDEILDKNDIHPFKNYIIDNLLNTYIEKIDNKGSEAFYNEKKNAQYANTILSRSNLKNDVIHYLLCIESNKVNDLVNELNILNDKIEIQIYKAFIKGINSDEYKFIKIYSKKIKELRVLKDYAKKNNYRIVGLTTSDLADNLLINSDYRFTCSDTLVDNTIKYESFDKLFKCITKTYYSKDYKKE